MAYSWIISYLMMLLCSAQASCAEDALMDMTASVSGEQCPAADDVGNFLQARIEVTMDNYNGGMGTTAGNSDLKPVGTRMSSKTSEYNLYNAIDGVASPYELAAAGSNACPVGRAVLQEDCLSAGSLVGGRSCGGLTTGHWGWVPTGCSINPGSKCTHWNTHTAPNSPGWQPVCNVPTTTTTTTPTTTTTTRTENEHYLYVGNGCCYDKFDHRPTNWRKADISEDLCRDTCGVESGCSAYNFKMGTWGSYCIVYGMGGRYGRAAPSGWTKQDTGWKTVWEWSGDGGVISKTSGSCGACFKKKPVNGYDIVGVGFCRDRFGFEMTSWNGPVMTKAACQNKCDVEDKCEGYKARDQDTCVLYGKELSSTPISGWSYTQGRSSIMGMRVARSLGNGYSICMKKI
mmetsp:Transcript_31401/g.57550  ORF Transcript_31401/g.57550 Transcript_31401/m.57550 type:complete len:401 (+) Transcript_31401:86-1288(+)